MSARRSACAVVLATAMLSACAAAPAPSADVTVRTVEIPVPLQCRPSLGPEPAYPDTDEALKAAPDLFARVRLLLAGRLMRMARDREKTAALKACAG